ncbi:MAG TPA: dihydrolipoamide acetyltransferase, partial [Marinobacter sp.]|nr:dihydrolipoamide acetyltransferase [Marinobacter sp.]
MSEQEIKVPDLGGADEVEVIELLVSAGDSVEAEDPILTIETDKASVELPSPGAGKIIKLTVKVGDKVKEGDVVGLMDASEGSDSDAGGSDESSDEGSSDEPEPKAEEKPQAKSSAKSQDEPAESKPAPAKKSGGSRKE